MRAVIQRVKSASVHSAGKQLGAIDQGLLILLGIEQGDAQEDIQYLVHKIARMRIFSDKNGNSVRYFCFCPSDIHHIP